MYMTHNAKSLSQGLWEFPENENTTFLAIRHSWTSEFNSCWHYKEVTLVLMPSFLAVYGVTMWLQARRLPNSKVISHGGRGIFCQYHQTCHSELSSKVLPTNPSMVSRTLAGHTLYQSGRCTPPVTYCHSIPKP